MKTRLRLTVKGTSLAEMAQSALEKADQLASADWTVEEVDLWGEEDVQAREGMLVVFSGSFTLVADVAIDDK